MSELFPGFVKKTVVTKATTINLVTAGKGPPLLLLHGYPQTHVMWHIVAPRLAADFTVVAPDLRGYGDSSCPATTPDHFSYSKRATAQDMVEAMHSLGFERFYVAGHDRGARVTHRLALDHADRVEKAAVLDIAPTAKVFATVNQMVATAYYHWFFLIQPFDLPERLIGADPEYYIRKKLQAWSAGGVAFAPAAMAEYVRCFKKPEVIHASCEDYRAAASIDLEHDRADGGKKVACPLLALWGERGRVHSAYDVLAVWRERAVDVQGRALPSGHFLAEEAPDETWRELKSFFQD